MLRKLAYLFLIIFFVMGAIAAYTFVATVNKAQTVAQPIGDFVQQLVLPATPVVLPSSTTIVRQINDLARLETASMELEKNIIAERNNDIMWGMLGETLIFEAHGLAVAGVDFANMTPADIQVVDPTTVMVHLPPATLFDDLPLLNTESSRVLDRDTGLFASVDPQLETTVRQEAEAVLREEAYETDLLEVANYNAQEFMLTFMQGLGFENVIFTEDIPPTVEPYQQEIPKGYVLVTPTPLP
ncbi:DUF4230 domain-containing protein [Candidatus Leptofilum sp.]|uniref:DUF4230 domain-containing protein n=1 Tax=Candidatus Leptofilum sp. TaxID=3241576 RepID=UPI003B58FA5B